MSNRRATLCIVSILIVVSSLAWDMPRCDGEQTKKAFTVVDEIGLTEFGFPYSSSQGPVEFSPDRNYFVVHTQRGRLDLNRPESSLRFYRTEDIEAFLAHSDKPEPLPVWVVNRSSAKENPSGAIISHWRWLADSSGVAFLEPADDAHQGLILADLRTQTIEPLTFETEAVEAYDIRDRNHFVYTVAELLGGDKMRAERQAPAMVGTGRTLSQLMTPLDDPISVGRNEPHQRHLWAMVDGKRFEVKTDNAPLVTEGEIELSPDGDSLVATMAVADVPQSWETLYPPPFPSSIARIHAGHETARQYVLIDLQTGSARALTGAPTGLAAGWQAGVLARPNWSSDGKAVVLPGTFLSSKEQIPSRPCVAVVDLSSDTRTCVETLKGGFSAGGHEEGYHLIYSACFAGADRLRVWVSFYNQDWSIGTTELRRTVDGSWQVVGQSKGVPEFGHGAGLKVTVKQWFNEPPLLVASDKTNLQVIWDPNPQLKGIELGQASLYKWKDKKGQEWEAGLYKPVNYKAGQRYPLVIQTHGFVESQFRPSGLHPTAFAAEALAAAGIVVLQVGDNFPLVTPEEGPTAVSNYESLANRLVLAGLVDPNKIGIIGFSRSCYYVMEMLTTSSLHLKAAAVTDGVIADYWQYMLYPERLFEEGSANIGAPPFGEGLKQWLKRSPGFNLDKITAPLLVVGTLTGGPLFMWEPYAGLHYLKKPVDLIILNSHEHVLTNPGVRLASQGGSVDWFRFWLQGYEDSDPAKVDQYKRWRELRKMQQDNEHRLATHKGASN